MGDEYVEAGGVGDQEGFELRCRSLAFASLLGTAVTFGVFAGADLVGELELALVTAAGMSTGIFSMWLDPSAQGQGLATEAVILVMQHAFEARDLHRVELPVTPDAPVRRSIEAVHCRDEGIAQGYARAEGGWADHVRYALTAEEWATHRTELLAAANEGHRLDR